MRAICGAIITAGALIGLGLAGIGIGTRYQGLVTPGVNVQEIVYLRWRYLDTPLMAVLVFLMAAALVGLAIAFVGLAYHHERRHYERHRALGGEAHTHVHT